MLPLLMWQHSSEQPMSEPHCGGDDCLWENGHQQLDLLHVCACWLLCSQIDPNENMCDFWRFYYFAGVFSATPTSFISAHLCLNVQYRRTSSCLMACCDLSVGDWHTSVMTFPLTRAVGLWKSWGHIAVKNQPISDDIPSASNNNFSSGSHNPRGYY